MVLGGLQEYSTKNSADISVFLKRKKPPPQHMAALHLNSLANLRGFHERQSKNIHRREQSSYDALRGIRS
jgi:hypothetical protein